MANNTGIVLIHGAGLGSFIWDKLLPMVNYPALAINFPNREVGDKINYKLSIDDYLWPAIDQIKKWNVSRIVIITHSIGGCLGLKLSDYLGIRVVGFIGISSVLPANGESFTDCLPSLQRYLMPLLLTAFGTRPPQKAIEHGLCNDLTSEQCAEIVRRYSPESKLLYTSKISYNKPKAKSLYVKLLNDNTLPVSLQDRMIRNLNIQKTVTLDSGHLPMVSKTQELSTILNRFLADLN